jgi:hypothetical protein
MTPSLGTVRTSLSAERSQGNGVTAEEIHVVTGAAARKKILMQRALFATGAPFFPSIVREKTLLWRFHAGPQAKTALNTLPSGKELCFKPEKHPRKPPASGNRGV